MAHTPGPWRVAAPAANSATTYLTAGENDAVVGIWSEGPGWGEQARANLRLIQMAPELHETLVDLLTAVAELVVAHDKPPISKHRWNVLGRAFAEAVIVNERVEYDPEEPAP